MGYEVLGLERDGHLAIITMNRPEVLNALNGQLTEELHAVLDELGSDTQVRVVILTGNGRGFCSGADVTGMRARAEEDMEALAAARARALANTLAGRVITQLPVRLRQLPQPVVGAINGVAAGAGLALALSCDIRIASEQARFASIFIKRSIMPDTGTSQMLPRLVGPGIAAEMALTGNVYDAKWALEKGLVNKVVPHDSLLEEARALTETIAGNPPIGVRLTKQLLYRNQNADLQQGVSNESVYNSIASQTEDSREAVLSFLEKRQPVFKGR